MNQSLYILGEGELFVRGESLVFNDTETSAEHSFPVKQFCEIYICNNIKLTYDMLVLISENNIVVHYFNKYEYYLGSYFPKTIMIDGGVLIKEVLCLNDDLRRLQLAKNILTGSFKNISRNINYYNNREKTGNIFPLGHSLNAIDKQTDINSLMLCEAKYRRIYYASFADIMGIPDFKREMHGSKNLPNILINFLNSLLYAVIIGEIHKTHLSGQIGVIHSTKASRFPLCYDISEVFKPLMVDRLVFKLLNCKIIKEEDIGANNRLNKNAVRTIFREWNGQLNKTIYHRQLKRHISYRMLIRNEIYKIENEIMGGEKYAPFVIWW